MIVICDCETNGLVNPDRLWLIVCKEVDTGKIHVFREPDKNPEAFIRFASTVTVWVGHNFLGFDYFNINRLCPGANIDPARVIDTLVVSRLVNFPRSGGHSLASYGEEYGLAKIDFSEWDRLSEDMVTYCIRDVEINFKVYQFYKRIIFNKEWKDALLTEHQMVLVCNDMHDHGFYFDVPLATELHNKLVTQTDTLHDELVLAFPPKPKAIREVCPRATKFGTLNRADFRFLLKTGGDLTEYTAGHPFTLIEWVPFNPGSTVQIVERLNQAGWEPTDKTKGHYLTEREYNRNPDPELEERLQKFRRTGWSVSETNLATLPPQAPAAAHTLAKYLQLKSRRGLVEDWLSRVGPDQRIHGTSHHIGAWTQRMSHSDPNLANIPTEKPQDTEDIKELNSTFRALFCVPKDRLLIGVDADSIQLRVLAHYMQDERFTQALIAGDKSKGTDLHSLNAKALGSPCKGRRDAKTFIYAWLLGAGVDRVSEILACTYDEARQAREDFLNYYPGLKHLRQVAIPKDAQRGYFEGLDGRLVICYGDTEDHRRHKMLGGYLQNGESTIMKRANLHWRAQLQKEKIPFWQVNFVHDEWQTETINDLDVAKYIAQVQADSIRIVGEELGLKCPMAGSVLNSHEELAIGRTWRETH